jgi:hypothetical protein
MKDGLLVTGKAIGGIALFLGGFVLLALVVDGIGLVLLAASWLWHVAPGGVIIGAIVAACLYGRRLM